MKIIMEFNAKSVECSTDELAEFAYQYFCHPDTREEKVFMLGLRMRIYTKSDKKMIIEALSEGMGLTKEV